MKVLRRLPELDGEQVFLAIEICYSQLKLHARVEPGHASSVVGFTA